MLLSKDLLLEKRTFQTDCLAPQVQQTLNLKESEAHRLRTQPIRQTVETPLPSMTAKQRVAIVGSGNWGCAIAKIVGQNAQRHNHLEEEVRMWVFEEMVTGRKLTDIINEDHENVKYMPGIKLPRNVIADADVVSATKGAHILIFVLPHQFLGSLCMKIRGNTAPDCIAVSLIKGVHFDETGMVLVSDLIKQVIFCTCFLDSGYDIRNCCTMV